MPNSVRSVRQASTSLSLNGRNSVLLDTRGAGPGSTVQGARLLKLARRFLSALDLDGVELSLTLVRDERIRELNRLWRDKDSATDVLSFPGGDDLPGPGPRMLGDVVISLDTARRQAKALGTTFEDELSLYLAHGLLHLLGHDHHSPREAQAMAREERRLLGTGGMLFRSGEGETPRGRFPP